jgi:TrmH family RNA methyltransferase
VGRTSAAVTGKSFQARLIEHFRRARRDTDLAVLEGFHALKHALRFEAELVEVVATDPEEVLVLAAALAPDLVELLQARMQTVSADVLSALAPRAPRTGVMATAKRPHIDVRQVIDEPASAPIVLLEDPRHMGNLGACIRVAAAADAAAVLCTGPNDPWHPEAIRGAAGLHFALPVVHLHELVNSDRPLVAIDPDGDDLVPGRLPPRSILAFGTERHGLSDQLLTSAAMRLRIPMRPGVSSLNLATSVAAVLYAWRFASMDGLGS